MQINRWTLKFKDKENELEWNYRSIMNKKNLFLCTCLYEALSTFWINWDQYHNTGQFFLRRDNLICPYTLTYQTLQFLQCLFYIAIFCRDYNSIEEYFEEQIQKLNFVKINSKEDNQNPKRKRRAGPTMPDPRRKP